MSRLAADYIFPPALLRRADLSRLIEEVETIDNDYEAQKVRSRYGPVDSNQATSANLADFCACNEITLSDDRQRQTLKEQLHLLKNSVPIVHLTFATDIDAKSLQTIVGWLREHTSPQVVVDVGLQPGLVGGVYIRTPNHVHDFSLRTFLQEKRDLIGQELRALAS